MATLVPRTVFHSANVQIPVGAVGPLVVEHISDLLVCAEAVLTRDRFTDESFIKPRPYRLPVEESLEKAEARVRSDISRFAEQFPDHAKLANVFAATLDLVSVSGDNVCVLGSTYRDALVVFCEAFEPMSSSSRARSLFTDDGLEVYVRIDHGHHLSPEQEFLAAVSELLAHRRDRDDNLAIDERIAVRAAYWLLDRGVHIPGAYPIWGTSGFRDVQTYASITDPGEGHLAGTTRYARYLHGVIVHVEHLERGISRSREELEPYRIPSPRTVARVRLHTGEAAPISSYIGRLLMDGTVDDSLIKTSRTFAAAATSLLSDGLAEVKFSVERLTASEAVRLLSSLALEVRRDRHAQVLSVAFNINTPLIDDREETVREHGGPVQAATAEEIGLLGIEIAAEAGFDKVTWDGTADAYPSRCITDQLGGRLALTLVHRAHELGLLTYFSAGFRFANIPDAVVTAVDGIGVGGAQILRFMDKSTGNHGPFLPDNINRILAIRDDAADTPAGRGARLLARLDRLHFEGTLEAGEEPRRIALFEALRDGDAAEVGRITSGLAGVLALPADSVHPLLAWAKRLLGGSGLLAEERIGEAAWDWFVTRVRRATDRTDLIQLGDLLQQASSRGAGRAGRPSPRERQM